MCMWRRGRERERDGIGNRNIEKETRESESGRERKIKAIIERTSGWGGGGGDARRNYFQFPEWFLSRAFFFFQ